MKDLKAIATIMKKLDLCTMITVDGNGKMHGRAMSNNGQVEYDGNSMFFSYEDTAKVRQLEKDSSVMLTFQTPDMLFLQIYGHGKIIRQKGRMEPYWLDELNQWFPEGLETAGLVMIQVEAKTINYWNKGEEFTINL